MDRFSNDRCYMKKVGDAFVASTASVMGRVTLGEDASVWYGSVLRGDDDLIQVGDRSNIQDNSVIHALPGIPSHIGTDVTIGHGAVIHMKSIGDRCLIGMGAILLGEAEIGDECVIGAGALVRERQVIPPRSLVVGMPARVIRKITDEEVEMILESAREYAEKARCHLPDQD